jgi:hypothetical protein
MLGMDGLAVENEGFSAGSVLGFSIPLGSWDAAGGASFGGSAMGCSGFKGPSGRAGRSGNAISSSIYPYQSSP